MIVTASKRYFSRLVPQLDGGFFPTFVAKLRGQNVLQNIHYQNELLRITRTSHYSLSRTIYLRPLYFGRFMDESFKPCEHLKLPVVIKNCYQEKPPDCLRLMILEAVLHLLVLKRENLFDENYLTNCDGAHYFGKLNFYD